MALHLQLQQKIQVSYHKGALTTLWSFYCGKFIVFNCKWKYYETAARFPGIYFFVKNTIALRNCCKWEPCKIYALHKICVCLWPWVKQPLHWYHGKNESWDWYRTTPEGRGWDWYRALRPVSTLCSNTGNKDLTWLVWLEAIPALYEHQPSRDLNWYQLCTSFIQVSIPGILPASYQPKFGLSTQYQDQASMKIFKSLYQTNTTVVETKNPQFFLGFF
jgi:hypothetical protein